MRISSNGDIFHFSVQGVRKSNLIQEKNSIHFVINHIFYVLMSFVVFYHSIPVSLRSFNAISPVHLVDPNWVYTPSGKRRPQAGPWFWASAWPRSAKYNWYCQQKHLQQPMQSWNALVMLKIEDSNDTVYAHYTWSVQTGYTLTANECHDFIYTFFNASLWWVTHWMHLHMNLYFTL